MSVKINLNNGSILEYKNGKWYKDGKYFTPYGLKHYKYYDSNKKSWMRLTETGNTTPYTPYMDRLRKQQLNIFHQRENNTTSQKFLPSQNIITLRTKGNMNLADVPVNMLDSIAINTGRSKTNIKTNLGLVGKESTFLGRSKTLGFPWDANKYISPGDLVNNHAYYATPEYDYSEVINKQLSKNNYSDQAFINAEKNIEYAYKHNLIKSRTKQYHNNILADAFARYSDNPKKYNPGQGNYIQMVTNIGNEVWGDPQIQNWWNTEGIKYYNKGLREGQKLSNK